MKLSKRGEYGMRALIYMTRVSDQQSIVPIKQIAQQENIPLKFLEQILLSLKNAGMLKSKMGANGGYYLAKPADQITLGEIERILDGPLAPISCVSKYAYEKCACLDEESCGLRMVMLDVRNAISDILDKTTLRDVIERINTVKMSS